MEELAKPGERIEKNELEAAFNIWAQIRYSQTSTQFGLMQNELGEPEWENIEKLRTWFRGQYGEEALRYVEDERQLAGRDLPPAYLELQEAERAMRPYWAVRETVERLFGKQYAESSKGQSFITKQRRLLRLSDPEMNRYYEMFYTQK